MHDAPGPKNDELADLLKRRDELEDALVDVDEQVDALESDCLENLAHSAEWDDDPEWNDFGEEAADDDDDFDDE